jgi:hypothetical protein
VADRTPLKWGVGIKDVNKKNMGPAPGIKLKCRLGAEICLFETLFSFQCPFNTPLQISMGRCAWLRLG